MKTAQQIIDEAVEEGLRLGHISIPTGSKWLQSAIIQAMKTAVEEVTMLAGRTCSECGEPSCDLMNVGWYEAISDMEEKRKKFFNE